MPEKLRDFFERKFDAQKNAAVGTRKFKAAPADPKNLCDGCAAARDRKLCNALPPCTARHRIDGAYVIWKEEINS